MNDKALQELLGQFAEDIINYDQSMTKVGAPPVRFVHTYIEKYAAFIEADKQRAVLDEIKGFDAILMDDSSYESADEVLGALHDYAEARYRQLSKESEGETT